MIEIIEGYSLLIGMIIWVIATFLLPGFAGGRNERIVEFLYIVGTVFVLVAMIANPSWRRIGIGVAIIWCITMIISFNIHKFKQLLNAREAYATVNSRSFPRNIILLIVFISIAACPLFAAIIENIDIKNDKGNVAYLIINFLILFFSIASCFIKFWLEPKSIEAKH